MKRIKLDFPLILLCAGKSERMGVPKGLLELNGTPWFLEHIRHFKEAGGSHVVVVLGYHAEKYHEKISWTADIHQDKWVEHDGLNIAVTMNPQPQHGQFSSIICALDRISGDHFPGAYVMPVDMLPPERNTWKEIANGLTGPVKVCIPAWRGMAGHPVLISGVFMDEIRKIPVSNPDARLDHQIRKLPKEMLKVVDTADKNIFGNANTPDEFNLLRSDT